MIRLWMGTFVLLGASIFAEGKTVLYAAAGPELTAYAVDVEGAALVRQSSVRLPENVQEAWPHPSQRYLYVAWSDNTGGLSGHNGVTAFRVNSTTGALEAHGQPISLRARSVFMTVDIPGQFLIVAYNDPSGATVHRISADGSLGALVPQSPKLDFGVYAHQVRVDPTNRMVVLVTRGNGPTATKAEDPGALKVFGYKDGVLSNRASIAPGGGYNFQPRHLEFHPTGPFAFITLERQNKLQVYRVLDGPTLSPTPLFTKETLRKPGGSGQATSSIHALPNGRFLYLGNRGGASGENSIAVYSINAQSGEPTLVQNVDTHGVHPRTFTIDPSGRILVVANMQQPAGLSVFRIGDDGKLEFVRKYDQKSSGGGLFWTGMLAPP